MCYVTPSLVVKKTNQKASDWKNRSILKIDLKIDRVALFRLQGEKMKMCFQHHTRFPR